MIGPPVTDVVISPHFEVRRDQNPAWFKITPHQQGAASVLARLDTGDWIGGAAYAARIGTFTVTPQGAESYVFRRPYSDYSDGETAVARAATGAPLGDLYKMAALLRDGKHDDPVLGALAAYAYSRAGSVDDVRRTVYYYARNNQPAPFDAILLARVKIEQDEFGYTARIPAVPKRELRANEERGRAWTYEATPAAQVRVAGGFPWLRQGWALLEDDFRPEFRRLAAFARELRPSVFTTLTPAAGEELARLVLARKA